MVHSWSGLRWRGLFMALGVLLVVLGQTHDARANTKTWQGGSSTWDNGAAWSPANKPLSGDTAHVWQAGASVTYQNPSDPSGLLNELSIDGGVSGATFGQAKDKVTTTETIIGDAGKGVFVQSGGTHIVTGTNGMLMGNTASGDGSYTLSGNAVLSVDHSSYLGQHGKVTFTQSGGTANFGTDPTPNNTGFSLAYGSGSSGSYTLSGGSLNAGIIYAGGFGAGQFKHSGGTATINGSLYIGASAGLTSEYQLSGTGVLSSQGVYVGNNGGTCKFTQIAGSNTCSSDLTVGEGSAGSYELQGGSVSSVNTYVGYYAGSPGTFVQSGGTHTVTGQLQIGNTVDAPGSSSYTFSGGTLTTAGTLLLHESGTYHQTAGSLKAMYLYMYPHSSVTISGGTVDLTDGTIQMDDITTSKADLTNRSLFLNYTGGTPVTTIRDYIAHAYNGGAWNQNGLTSSTAAVTPGGALGYGEAKTVLGLSGNATANWQGHNADATSILIRYTLAGDANLDGTVDFQDLVKVAQNYNTVNGWMLWSSGDFNYDGNVDFNDLVKLAQNYNHALPSEVIAGAPAGFEADLARAFAAVPEPSIGGVLTILAMSAFSRHGRRRSHQIKDNG